MDLSGVVNYASPQDDMAVLYVNDRTARLYSSDHSGELESPVTLRGRQGVRFIFWNHNQCYGPLRLGASNN